MSAHSWDRLQSVFLEALERPPGERRAFLERNTGDDPALWHQVEALLECHANHRALAIEERLIVDRRDHPDAAADPSLAGTLVGPYRLVRRIGRGGMGDVYLAHRDAPYRQDVAVKMLRYGFQVPELLRRFRAEQQILASLAHPKIARLLDGGITDDGRPYLVLEYVAGEPITDYCDRSGLTTHERLALFRDVCDAVQFAHGNLVVHRDIKPSNVLVNGDGEVRLLDFGIAKLLDPGTDAPVDRTRSAVRLMTPEYAAPEQARGGPITTATDVHGLGTLLYELLTGHHPYRRGATTPAEIERAICEEEPPAPSAVAPRLRKALRGDLDTIVMMALRKEPERRYASAAQLAEDIERYLLGRPVLAQKDTVGYRVRKFVRRNPTPVALAASFLVSILGFAAVMAVMAGSLARERDRARVEAEKATQIASFLTDLFQAPDPFATATGRDTLRVGDFLALGAGRARDGLNEQPEVQAELLNVLGSAFRGLGSFDAAEPLVQQALAIRQELFGPAHLDVAESRAELAAILKDRGRAADADSLLRLSLDTRRALLGPEHPDIASTLNALASVVHDQGDLPGADSLYRQALAMQRRLLGPRHLDVATTLNNLSTLSFQMGDVAAADSLVRQALDLRRDLLGPDHLEVALTMGQLATIARGRGDPAEGEALYRDALRILRDRLGAQHVAIAHTLQNLASLLRSRGELDEAERLFREAVDQLRAIHGDQHPDLALTMHNLASLLKAKGELVEAEALYRESLAMRRTLLGETHPAVAASLNNLGVLLKAKGDYAGAAAFLEEAIAVNIATLGPDHPRVATTMITLGDLWSDAGRPERAESLLLEALAIHRSREPLDSAAVATATRRLYELYRALGRPEQAERYATPTS